MNVEEKLRLFLDSAGKNEGTATYRDPQEFMYMESRDNSSYVYAFGMSLFKLLTGTDYFEYIHIPEDEYFMTMDPESDFPIIKPENVPDYISEFSKILGQMTMYKRKSRISVQTALDHLEHMYDNHNNSNEEKNDLQYPQTTDTNEEYNDDLTAALENIKDESKKNITELVKDDTKVSVFPQIQNDYDYGVILNNKRYGRIEFRCLYDCVSNQTDHIDIPIKDGNAFTIGVSKRHKEYKQFSNPSSVYGDNIIPAAVINAQIGEYKKIRIEFHMQAGYITIKMYELDMNNNIISGSAPLKTELKPV